MKLRNTFAALGTAFLLSAGAAQAAPIYATQIDSGRVGGAGWDSETQVNNINRDDAGNALGAPDSVHNTPGGFYSLGAAGNAGDASTAVAVVGFGKSFRDQATAWEVTFNCTLQASGTCSYSESMDIYTFSGAYTPFDTTFTLGDLKGLGFTYAASVPNGSAQGGFSVMIGAGPFSYLALVDTSAAGGARDGFDVDAIGVSTVPLPASALLLFGALGGLGAMRRFGRKA